MGDLRALTWTPADPVAGVVLVDGSGEGACDDWSGWAERVAELGVVVLAHDRPGCGGSPGEFRTQTLADRADESLAALAWIDERAARLTAGEDPESVLAAQRALCGRPWHPVATQHFDSADMLAYLAPSCRSSRRPCCPG